MQLENPRCLLRLSATDFHVAQKSTVLKRWCNTLCNRKYVTRDKMNPNIQGNTFCNSLQEKVASSTSIMWSVVISSAVPDRHELSKQNKTNKTDIGTQHLKHNCWKSTNPPPKTTQWSMELVEIVTHFKVFVRRHLAEKKNLFTRKFKDNWYYYYYCYNVRTEITRGHIFFQQIRFFYYLFLFSIIFSCYLVGRKKSTTYVSSNCLQQIDINNKKLRQLVSYIF